MIPKIAHFYWGTNTPMSFMRYMTLKSFKNHNPDWEINLYSKDAKTTPRWKSREKQDQDYYFGEDYLNKAKDLGINILDVRDFFDYTEIDAEMSDVHISDILAWKLLDEVGGVISDMDILYINSIKNIDVLNEDLDAVLCEFYNIPNKHKLLYYVPVSFMASSGQHDGFKHIFENAVKKYTPLIYECAGAISFWEKGVLDFGKYFNLNTKILPITVIQPDTIQTYYSKGPTKQFQNKKNILGMHWFGGQPLSKNYNSSITETTIMAHNTVLFNLMKKEI